MTKITRATFKSFIRKNLNKLYIKNSASFDGMTDGLEWVKDAQFIKAQKKENSNPAYDFGIRGVWLTSTNGDDRFRAYEDGLFSGITVDNCCGKFTIAIQN